MEILYEDNHIIAVNKRAGEIVQSDKTGDRTLADDVKDYIKVKYNKPGDVFLGIVHRIDRPVSGVVLFARTSKALARLNEMFKNHTVKKIYWAITQNRPPQEAEELHHYMSKNEEKNRTNVSISPRTGYKEAVLSYKLLSSTPNINLLEVELQTGRHHQIRAQLSRIGCPIRGDLKYGSKRSNDGGGINLHSRRLVFKHPVKDEMITIEAPLPDESVWKAFE
ncbi:MAG: RNA pseudouridine synthase [Marinilabiliaceae bacterium]|nr:RNA pseudouridine synthase [Marinilabiliaceae bacterium]